MSENQPNPFDMMGGGMDMGALYQQMMSGFMKDYMEEVKEIAKAESLIAALPATRELYMTYNAVSKLLDIVSRYEHFSEEEVEAVKSIGKKLCKIIREKAKKSNVDISEEALKKVINEGLFE